MSEQTLSVTDGAHGQFEQAYQLVGKISGQAIVGKITGQISRSEAWQCAHELLRDWPTQQHLAEHVQALRLRLSELEQRLRLQHNAERLLQEFCKRHGQDYQPDDLDALLRELEERLDSLSQSVSEAGEQRMACVKELEQLQ